MVVSSAALWTSQCDRDNDIIDIHLQKHFTIQAMTNRCPSVDVSN